MPHADVAIIGAGVAGLSAARLLARHGQRCLLLEARDALGGRVMTCRRPGWQIPIELGAEFVHGRPAPTLALGHGSVNLVHVPEHRVEITDHSRPLLDAWQRFAAALEGGRRSSDWESVADYLRRVCLPERDARLVRQLVEGYHAAPLEAVSVRPLAEDAARSAVGLEQYRTAQGYDQVLSVLEHGLRDSGSKVLLRTQVERVEWSRHGVKVHARSADGPQLLRARRCIVTTSLGVLASRSVRFEPEPTPFRSALPFLAMGSVTRVVLRFEQAPWLAPSGGIEPTFIHVPGAAFPMLWREARAGQTNITCWAGGPAATQVESLDGPALIDAALRSLARATGRALPDCRAALIEAHHHDFMRDPFFRGAYGYVRPGGRDAARTLAEPQEDTLFFAGEALDREFPGTVAGALASGERAARLTLRAARSTSKRRRSLDLF